MFVSVTSGPTAAAFLTALLLSWLVTSPSAASPSFRAGVKVAPSTEYLIDKDILHEAPEQFDRAAGEPRALAGAELFTAKRAPAEVRQANRAERRNKNLRRKCVKRAKCGRCKRFGVFIFDLCTKANERRREMDSSYRCAWKQTDKGIWKCRTVISQKRYFRKKFQQGSPQFPGTNTTTTSSSLSP